MPRADTRSLVAVAGESGAHIKVIHSDFELHRWQIHVTFAAVAEGRGNVFCRNLSCCLLHLRLKPCHKCIAIALVIVPLVDSPKLVELGFLFG